MTEDETMLEHESFGFIRVTHTSGHRALFDSALNHQHYISVTIGRARQKRHLHHSTNYAGEELITVAMSTAQFAEFVTTPNVHSGAACTLTRIMGKGVAPPPEDINTRETFEKEVRERAKAVTGKLVEALAELTTLQAKGKATKAEITAVMNKVSAARTEIESNMPWMMTIFTESIEKLVARAKVDINTHAQMSGLRRVAIGGDEGAWVPPVLIEGNQDEGKDS